MDKPAFNLIISYKITKRTELIVVCLSQASHIRYTTGKIRNFKSNQMKSNPYNKLKRKYRVNERVYYGTRADTEKKTISKIQQNTTFSRQ